MAKTQAAQMSFTIQDGIGVKAANTYYLLVDPAITVTQLNTEWAAQAALIAAVIDGNIIGGKVSIVQTIASQMDKPTSDSRVEQTGLFTLGNASNTRSFGEDVPTWSNGKIVGGKIPLTDSDVEAYVGALTTPQTLYEYTNNQFLVLNALRSAAITFRKHRRPERALTYEV